jgi:hypothetical protein
MLARPNRLPSSFVPARVRYGTEAASWQFDHKMRLTGVKERPNDCEAFAGMRMVRILDDDFKRLLLGSMS